MTRDTTPLARGASDGAGGDELGELLVGEPRAREQLDRVGAAVRRRAAGPGRRVREPDRRADDAPAVALGEVAVLPHLWVVGDLGVRAHRREPLAGRAQDGAPLGGAP